ncbi:MAG: tyrosine--tRNA ligase [Eubacteriales bacterium]|nr:tyrosine--tRNA ligase [Eubacteriales bacterium]
MTKNVYDVLAERGYIAQVSHADELRDLLGQEKISFYTGYDPTADSLHVGHLLQLMAMSHLQKAGHRPVVLLGGGTGMIGDPSGRSDMRQLLSPERVQHNVDNFRKQMSRFIDFSDGKAIFVNNADWILPLNYIEFIRDVGPAFSVNRMLAAECYKNRMEQGLTFLEFNYMILQANDFLHLYRTENCKLQLGGDDQWSNILAGTDLIRRKGLGPAYALTFTLLTKADGEKMGKTSSGALWLDEDKLPVYDFYQYWRNIDDRDVIKCLKLLTYLPLEEIAEYEKLEGSQINEAKKRLALEVTSLVHGVEKAQKAEAQAEEIFGAQGQGRAEGMPGKDLSAEDFERPLLDILVEVGFIPSKSEGRRLIKQNGLKLNEENVSDFNRLLTKDDLHEGAAIVRRGKKNYFALKFAD